MGEAAEIPGRALSVGDRIRRLRDRVLSDPAFLRWAGGTMLGRAISRRESRAMFDVAAGFVYAQVLTAAVRLRLFETLMEGPLTVGDLARRLGLPERSTDLLLLAAEPMRLVERRSGGRWGIGRRGAALFGNAGLIAMIRHHDLFYRELADPVALLKRGTSEAMGAFWPYAGAAAPGAIAADSVAPYSRLMAASQSFLAPEILAAYKFGRHRHLVDVGGGEGVFAIAAAERYPALRVTVVDLPPVAARARERIDDAGLGGRVDAIGADFVRDALPEGADIVSLVRIVHDHDDAVALALLRNVFAALPPGGTVVIAEPTAGAAAAPGIASYFALYLLAMGTGRPRTIAELSNLLTTAGFRSVRCLRDRNPIATRVVTAKVPVRL
ncbi:methyltransferase [Acuticoccus kandeliae]|uniref:methyltransferase n=1 Tax=Acuticoccus kandeliae TaxID=2073160 RepID=UPI000D3EAEBD|nr:methyltransferase [Acuticoccus kandeliae]